MAITKRGLHLKSGQVLIAEDNYVVIQLTKPYLTTPGVTVHGQYGAILYERDTLVTFIYKKLRYGSITQGLLKVKQVLEVHSLYLILMNRKKRVNKV